jgi:hypothetical protein
MDLPVPAEDALAQPTRAQIFTFLVEKRGPARTEDLEQGFVTRSRVRVGREIGRELAPASGDSVRENPQMACGLHRSVTAGILAELDPKAKLTEFEPRDPESAGCVVEVRTG